jgi:hypothetical protein
MLIKKPLHLTSFFAIMLVCDVFMAKTKYRGKTPYIVHMAMSQMPASFNHHSHWYESTLRYIAPHKFSTPMRMQFIDFQQV